MAYMVAGYLIIWLVSFVLIFSMVRRQRDLQREIEILKELARDTQGVGGK
jgi:CcmD family protein